MVGLEVVVVVFEVQKSVCGIGVACGFHGDGFRALRCLPGFPDSFNGGSDACVVRAAQLVIRQLDSRVTSSHH